MLLRIREVRRESNDFRAFNLYPDIFVIGKESKTAYIWLCYTVALKRLVRKGSKEVSTTKERFRRTEGRVGNGGRGGGCFGAVLKSPNIYECGMDMQGEEVSQPKEFDPMIIA